MGSSNGINAGTAAPASCQCIIKLGGSAITKKADLETLRPEVLGQICRSIGVLHSTSHKGIVLVHGAGSFGHFQASEYAVAKGGRDAAAAVEGFVKTRRSVTQLNHLVVSALIDAGVPAVGLSPCGTWYTDNRQLQNTSAGIAAVASLLQHGMVPVLHGDAVMDAALGVTILSGDQIIRGLAEALQPSYCVFLTDVGGLFSKPPGQPGAQLIPAVEVAPDGSWCVPATAAAAGSSASAASDSGSMPCGQPSSGSPLHQSSTAAHTAGTSSSNSSGGLAVQLSVAAHDTTGGMATKIAEAAAVVLTGCPVVIAQAGTPSGAAALLHGPSAFTAAAAAAAAADASSSGSSSQSVQQGILQLDLSESEVDNSSGSGASAATVHELQQQLLQGTVVVLAGQPASDYVDKRRLAVYT